MIQRREVFDVGECALWRRVSMRKSDMSLVAHRIPVCILKRDTKIEPAISELSPRRMPGVPMMVYTLEEVDTGTVHPDVEDPQLIEMPPLEQLAQQAE